MVDTLLPFLNLYFFNYFDIRLIFISNSYIIGEEGKYRRGQVPAVFLIWGDVVHAASFWREQDRCEVCLRYSHPVYLICFVHSNFRTTCNVLDKGDRIVVSTEAVHI